MDVNHAEPPPATPCTCAMLRRTARRVTRLYDRALRPTGLRLTQYSVLATLERAGPLAAGALAARLEMERTTLTRNLRPLIAAGWVGVETAPDRRRRTVTITPAGRRAVRRAFPVWQQTERRLRRLLGRDQAATLRGLLDATLERLARP